MRAHWPIVVSIPRVPPSGNQIVKGRMHFHAYKDLRRTWEMELAGQVTEVQRRRLRGAASEGAMLVEIAVTRARELEDDNLVSGCKPVRDACANVGFVMSDGAVDATFRYSQAKKPGRGFTLITFRPRPA